MEGRIKLHRKIDQWGWRSKPNTFSLFMYLLTNASIKDSEYQGHKIKKGDCVVGRKKLALELGMSEQSVRTALSHLKSTNEVTIKSTKLFSIVTLVGFDKYQSRDDYLTKESTKPSTDNQPDSNQQVTTLEEGKKIQEEKEKIKKEMLSFFQDEENGLLRQEIYNKELRNDFYNYWTEILLKGKNKGHCRYVDEKTWNLQGRLDTFLRYRLKDEGLTVSKRKERCKKKFN